jgi:hypothetical protein
MEGIMYNGEERRASNMSGIDPEKFGELNATVKSLEKNMASGFERLERSFTDFKETHDLQARKDYEYLDDKIDRVRSEVKPLIEAHNLRQKGFISTVQKKASELAITGVLVFIIGWAVWTFSEYMRTIK